MAINKRTSPSQRLRMKNLAEAEIMRYADDHYLWHKHVHNVELDSMQILKCIEMDKHPNTIDYSCRRTGKTAVKELYHLKENATKPDQEEGIVAPREGQARKNLEYHLDAIRRSPILSSYITHKSGRKQIADTYYQFANRSRAEAYGIMANVDGGDLTTASLEEVDDMPRDRLYSRFLLMLGANRRLGAAKDTINNPQIRITGVFKGADTLTALVRSENYQVLPIIDVYLGIELGIINEQFMMDMRAELAPDEYIRQLLCKNISSRNLIWELWVRRAIQLGVKARAEIIEPMPGEVYKKRGLLSFGYDAGGHGENPTSSKHALVVIEQLGNFFVFLFAKTWPAGTDESIVKADLLSMYRYFRPDVAHGDAFGVGMLTSLNDDLYREGLTTINRHAIGDGDSTASTWPEWAFSPLRFEGMTKHQMAMAVRSIFHNGSAVMPYIDDSAIEQAAADMHLLQHQLPNVTKKPTSKSYASYGMANPKLGDDLFDATMAAVWGMWTRLAVTGSTVVLLGQRSRESMLEKAS